MLGRLALTKEKVAQGYNVLSARQSEADSLARLTTDTLCGRTFFKEPAVDAR